MEKWKYASFDEAVKEIFGESAQIKKMERVYGGDINDAFRMILSDGRKVFFKTNRKIHMDFFEAEAEGLKVLGNTGTIKVPAVLGMGTSQEEGTAFLILEYVESVCPGKDYWEKFGHQLAKLHQAACRAYTLSGETQGKYGFCENNFIGASPQKNEVRPSWVDFYRDCRLGPQFQRAELYLGEELRKKADQLLEHLEKYLREPEFPSLLHGDLWSGNMICGSGGNPWVIDPAVYVGDFETDLAMTELFGRLPETFYSAYSEQNPIDRGGYKERKDLYHLYHLLNHLNLFGSSYLENVSQIICRYCR